MFEIQAPKSKMANAEEIAEEFLMEIAMLRPARRTMPLLVDFVYHQISSLNDEALGNEVLEIMVPRIDQEFFQPPQLQPPQPASPLAQPMFPQLPPSPTASTISIISSQTETSVEEPQELPPPLNLEPQVIQYIPVIPVIHCFNGPHQVHSVTLQIPTPPEGYVNPSGSVIRTQVTSYYPAVPAFLKNTTFDIHVKYQVIASPTQVCPTNGEVQ